MTRHMANAVWSPLQSWSPAVASVASVGSNLLAKPIAMPWSLDFNSGCKINAPLMMLTESQNGNGLESRSSSPPCIIVCARHHHLHWLFMGIVNVPGRICIVRLIVTAICWLIVGGSSRTTELCTVHHHHHWATEFGMSWHSAYTEIQNWERA